MKHFLLRLLISIGLIGCSGLKPAARVATPTPTIAPTPTVLQDDYAIYTTVLQAVFGSSGVFVINQTTSTYPPAGDLAVPKGDLPALSQETLSDFNKPNKLSDPLKTIFTGEDPRFILTNRSDFYEKPTVENGLSCTWMRVECFNEPKFKAAYPHASGIFPLSPIGYNADRTQALVTVQQDYGQDSGVINVILLSKEAGQWKIADRYEIQWII